ncbi:protein ACCELERATED CELL DEATH 6-like [Hevea brasiliensis]|uniref:protein ACCELERATED CELL DEATH 6-like n=1 Tax=Hevea brasiliensis TaxID=3981 RepID=UPI0025FEF84D|nr:protein ACCELERATED CELL DEATH 6-like [Hevea brasiliensis]
MEICTYIGADLLEAAENGKLDPFKNYGAPLDSLLSPNKNTILHIYLSTLGERSTEFIEEILEIFPPLLLKVNVHGDTPLHIAARYGHADAAKVLIKQAKGLPRESGEGPREREMKAVRKMLRMTNKNKETALHEAARNERSLGVVEAIMIHEDPNEFKYSANNRGESPLYLAVKSRNVEIASELLRHPNSQLLAYGRPTGKTALHEATMLDFGDEDFKDEGKRKKLLEKYRSMAKEKDQKERTEHYSGYTVYMMIDQLLEKWSNLAKETDEKGWTPLHYAAYARNWLAVHVLLNKDKSTAYIADKYWKRTALHIAACRGFQYEMELIISECPDCCELTDSRGWNVIHYAVISKNDGVLKAVLQYSSLIYLLYGEDVKGNTPVHLYKTYHSRLPSLIKNAHEDNDMFKHWRTLHDQIQMEGDFKSENLAWMKDIGTGPLGKIEVQNIEGLKTKKNMIRKFEEIKDSHLVAAALIATVTFAAMFTLPGGYISYENNLKKGTPILSGNSAFTAFMISDTIAMVLSTSFVFILFLLVMLGYLERYYWLIKCAFSFLFYAMVAMVITFVTGAYAVLAPSFGYSICVFGLSFFCFIFHSIISVTWSLFLSEDDDDEEVNSYKHQT